VASNGMEGLLKTRQKGKRLLACVNLVLLHESAVQVGLVRRLDSGVQQGL